MKNTNFWTQKRLIVAACATGAMLLLLIALLCWNPFGWGEEPVPTDPTTSTQQTEQETEPSTVETTEPEPTGPVMLEEYVELYEKNPDLAGWIRIEGTVIDYPVMYTPEDGEKYIYADFEGKFDTNGLPFIEDDCSLDPESDNLIIHGHNMMSGKMFASLLNYAYKNYWEAHPIIEFSNLYENREYEIVAAFYDRLYSKNYSGFKYYQFVDAEDEEHFQEAIDYFKYKSCYETGVDAEYGDNLIMLVTCSWHTKYGRFVVVGREVKPEAQIPETTTP